MFLSKCSLIQSMLDLRSCSRGGVLKALNKIRLLCQRSPGVRNRHSFRCLIYQSHYKSVQTVRDIRGMLESHALLFQAVQRILQSMKNSRTVIFVRFTGRVVALGVAQQWTPTLPTCWARLLVSIALYEPNFFV